MESASTLLGVVIALVPLLGLLNLQAEQRNAVLNAIFLIAITLTVSVLSTTIYMADSSPKFLSFGLWFFFFGVLAVFGLVFSFAFLRGAGP